MINIIDLIVGVLILFYLLKSIGGIFKIIKGLLAILLFLIVFGVVVRLIQGSPFVTEPAQKMLGESYAVKISYSLIRLAYPAIEKSAPQVDSFIKEKIISAPTPEVSVPKIIIPEKSFPKLGIPEFPKSK